MSLSAPDFRSTRAAAEAAGHVVLAAAGGGAVWMGAQYLNDPTLMGAANFAAPGLVGLGVAGAAHAYRQEVRAEVIETLQRALSPQIGPPINSTVTARSWESLEVPRKIVVRYDPTAQSDDLGWETKILDSARRRLKRRYKMVAHDEGRCRLVLKVVPLTEEPEQAPDPFIAERAEEIVKQLLGTNATYKATWDEDRLIRLSVTHKSGLRVSPNAIVRTRIEQSLERMLPGRWRARWDLVADTVVFEVRPSLPASVLRSPDEVAQEDLRKIPYGVDEDMQVLHWDLRSSAGTPHFLVNGATGAGKTVLMRGVVVELTRPERGWRVRIGDPKRVEFIGLKNWSNVEIVATSTPDIVATIHDTNVEMEKRYQAMENGEDDSFEPLFLLLDEFRYFYGQVNTWWQSVKPSGAPKECPILDEFNAIAVLGRTADVHLIVGTQRPDAQFLGGDTRDQFGARCSLGRLSPEGARMMWAAHHIGVSVPRGCPGRGTAVSVEGQPVEMQSYWTPDPTKASGEDRELLEAMRPQESLWPRRVVVPPSLEDEEGRPIELKGSYPYWRDAELALLSEHPDLEQAAHAADLRTGATASVASPGTAPIPEIAEEEVSGVDRDYLEPRPTRVSDLQPGQMVLIDEPTDTWGVIETVEDDIAGDEDSAAVCWRSDDGTDYGVLSLEGGGTVAARQQREPDDSRNT